MGSTRVRPSRPGTLVGMRWTVPSEKPLYEDEWLDIRLADVELPDGRHLAHRLICTPPGAGCVTVKDGRVLLLWRHRSSPIPGAGRSP